MEGLTKSHGRLELNFVTRWLSGHMTIGELATL